MPILNYTTTIAVEKTVAQIQAALAKAGAQAVLSEFDNEGVLSALSFRLSVHGQMVFFRLPANIDKLYIVLQNDGGIPRRLRTREQAARVAWRIIRKWILAQLAIVETEQAELAEVFLPYAQNPNTGETLYNELSANNFAALEYKQ